MSDSPYDPSPELLARIRDREAADAAAKRLAEDPQIKVAVENLKQIEKRLEEAIKDPSTAPASDAATYVADVKPEPVKGHLTRPRILVQPRKNTGYPTVRALSLSPLVRLGLADVGNDGRGDVKTSYRWGKIALYSAPFVLLALYAVVRIASDPAQVAAPAPAATVTVAPAAEAPLAEAPTSVPMPVAPPTTELPAVEATSLPSVTATVEASQQGTPSKPSTATPATARPTAVPTASPAPTAKPTSKPSGGWTPEF